MSNMSINIEKYKALLLEEKAKLEGELKGLGRSTDGGGDWMAIPGEQPGPLGNADPDVNVQADYIEEFEERVSTLSTIEAHYEEIVEALERISEGTYGICKICSGPIEEERLSANPAATTCILHMGE